VPNYKYSQFFYENQAATFDEVYVPGVATPASGIYRCEVCGHEVCSVTPHPLPPQTHPLHPVNTPIRWLLVAAARHNGV